jgi:hypothetical protein
MWRVRTLATSCRVRAYSIEPHRPGDGFVARSPRHIGDAGVAEIEIARQQVLGRRAGLKSEPVRRKEIA